VDNFAKKLAEKIGIVVQGGVVNIRQLIMGEELSRQAYRNRQAILTKVRNSWIKGVLEKSLHDQIIMKLGMERRLDAVTPPWNLAIASENQSPTPLPEGTPICEVFDNIGAGRTLLILGEPGCGRTITLLQLARDLLDRAQADSQQRIPIVLNLSSWVDPKQTIATCGG
jgi:predicted NACHT family NTPase